jgi:hypothetical protein
MRALLSSVGAMIWLQSARAADAVALAPNSCCDGQFITANVGGEPVWQVASGNSYLYFDVPASFTFAPGAPVYVEVQYYDEGHGTLRLEYDSTKGNALPDFYSPAELHTRSSRVNSREFVHSYQQLLLPKFAGRQNGGADFRLTLNGGGTVPLSVRSVTVQNVPFDDPKLQYVLSKPWLKPYVGLTKEHVDRTTLNHKLMVGYQGWFRAPNDLDDRGWVHWCREGVMIPENFTVDQWPDLSEFAPDELFRAGEVQTGSGQPAFLFSSTTRETVRRHFRWMRQYNIDGVFLARFVHPDSSGAYGHPEWVLNHVREAANLEGRIWAISYDISAFGSDPRLYDVITADWKWLVDVVGIRRDARYAYEATEPVVQVWGLPFPDRNVPKATADKIVDFLKNDPVYGGNYVIGGIPWSWSNMTDWHDHFRKYDGVQVWMPENNQISSYSLDQQRFQNWGIDYFAHVWPGFSWANLQRLTGTAQYTPRNGGAFFWQKIHEALSGGATRLIVGMFDEYDEGTAIMPMSDDPPNPPPSWGRFVTNDGRPSDWWLRLTGGARESLLGYRPLSPVMPTEADLDGHGQAGPEAWIDLGPQDESQRLHRTSPEDGNTTAEVVAGRQCRYNSDPMQDLYFYFNVADDFVSHAAGGMAVSIDLEYYDRGGNVELTLEYDGVNGPYTLHPKSISTRGSGEWRTVRFNIEDAYFGNRQNGGSDFRLRLVQNVKVNLDRVWVTLPVGTAFRPTSETGLTAAYYDNGDFTALRAVRVDPEINFDWGYGSPDPQLGPDTFSVRWTGQVETQCGGAHTFYTTSNDGVRLWIDGQLLIDSWTNQAQTENQGTITLAAGRRYDLKMEYYEAAGEAAAKLAWSSDCHPKEIVPSSRLFPSGLLSPRFSTDFSNGPAPGSILHGSAVLSDGVLKLTTLFPDQEGSFIIEDLTAGAEVAEFIASFKVLVDGGTGADGFSFNFGSDLPDGPFGEEGAGTGLTIAFDTFDNGGGEAPAIDVKWGGNVVAHNPAISPRTGDRYVDVLIGLNHNGTLDVLYDGTPAFTELPVGYTPMAGGRFGLGARTGGSTDNHFIDDLVITVFPSPPSPEMPQAVRFQNAGDFIEVPHSASLPLSQITIEFWLRVRGLGDPTRAGGEQTILDKRGDSRGYNLRVVGTSFPLELAAVFEPALLVVPAIIESQTWHHIAATHDGSVLRLYVDGRLAGSHSSAYAGDSTAPLRLGEFLGYPGTSLGLRGEMDELRIWNQARSESQLNAFKHEKLSGAEIGLVAYWNFDADSGRSIRDRTGNGHHGLQQGPGLLIPSGAPIGFLLPATPAGLRAIGREDAIELEWKPEASALSYAVYRGAEPDFDLGTESQIGTAPASAASFTDSTAVPRQGYYYRIVALDQQQHASNPSKPAASRRAEISDNYFAGVYYYPWYGPQGHAWPGQYVRDFLAVKQPPLLGHYDSRNREVIQRHLRWMQRSGIDFLVSSWWGQSSHENTTLRDQIVPELAGSTVQFTVFYESPLLGPLQDGRQVIDPAKEERLVADFRYLARTFFGHPNFLRIDGRPVVFFYLSHTLGGNYAQAFNRIRAELQVMGHSLFLIGDEMTWGEPDSSRLAFLDGVTSYIMYGNAAHEGYPLDREFYADISRKVLAWETVVNDRGKLFIPVVHPGFNNRTENPLAYVAPRQMSAGASLTSTYEEYLKVMRPFADPRLKMIMITSWNEWHEDTQIEPAISTLPTAEDRSGSGRHTQNYTYQGYGTAFLEITREFLASGLINHPPALSPIPNQTSDEETLLQLIFTGIDPDLPNEQLTFLLEPGAPTGAVLDAFSGTLRWTPTEEQGPGTYSLSVRLTDDGIPPLSVVQSFSVDVREVNRSPQLFPVEVKTINAGEKLEFTVRATDPDVPANRLTFSLDPGAPPGAGIDPATGLFTWMPWSSQGGATHEITVRVTDDGIPKLEAAQTFTVEVQSDTPSVNFSADFEAPPPGSTRYGHATVADGVLKLTTAHNDQQGSFIIADLVNGAPVAQFTARFKALVGGGTGADGFSFNFASDLPNAAFGEEGAGAGLTIAFDTFDNGGGEAPAIDVKWRGRTVARNAAVNPRTNDRFVDVLIRLHHDGTLDVVYDGAPVFRELSIGYTSLVRARFGFGARTGGLHDNHFIDDLFIAVPQPPLDNRPLLRYERSGGELTLFWTADAYLVQQADQLGGAPGNWRDLTSGTSPDGVNFSATLPLLRRQQFYQLRRR